MSKPRWLMFCIMLSLGVHAYAGDNTVSDVSAGSSRDSAELHVESAQHESAQQLGVSNRGVDATNIAAVGTEGTANIRPDDSKLSTARYEASAPGSSAPGQMDAKHLDVWLMLLVAAGLVVLQLRRKQKTLPQRPLADSENKVFWG